MSTEHIPLTLTCPYCQVTTDCTSPIKKMQGPAPGDISICQMCAKISVFTVALTLRRAGPDEVADAMDDPVVERAVLAVQRRR